MKYLILFLVSCSNNNQDFVIPRSVRKIDQELCIVCYSFYYYNLSCVKLEEKECQKK